MFDTHGIPNQIMSDNGSPFDSTEIDRYMKKGIKHHPVTPLWPHPNGEAKSFMKPLERPLKQQNKKKGTGGKKCTSFFSSTATRRTQLPKNHQQRCYLTDNYARQLHLSFKRKN